jgi:hypothetical protein
MADEWLDQLMDEGIDVAAVQAEKDKVADMRDRRPAIAVCHMWWAARRASGPSAAGPGGGQSLAAAVHRGATGLPHSQAGWLGVLSSRLWPGVEPRCGANGVRRSLGGVSSAARRREPVVALAGGCGAAAGQS